jgi:hypothetical protein
MITRWPPVNTLTRRPAVRVCQAGRQRLNDKLSRQLRKFVWVIRRPGILTSRRKAEGRPVSLTATVTATTAAVNALTQP